MHHLQLAEGQGEQIVQILLKRWNNEPLPDELPVIKLKGVLGSLKNTDLVYSQTNR